MNKNKESAIFISQAIKWCMLDHCIYRDGDDYNDYNYDYNDYNYDNNDYNYDNNNYNYDYNDYNYDYNDYNYDYNEVFEILMKYHGL
jgi:hypothetical protein